MAVYRVFAAGLQVDGRQQRHRRRRRRRSRAGAACRRRSRCRRRASARIPPPVDAKTRSTSRRAARVRRLSRCAYNALAADVYWIRAIQYYGGAKRRLDRATRSGRNRRPMLAAVDSREYDQLYTLLDITTTLDPLFDIAYRFGAVFLAEAYPAGAGRADLAVKLLEKGLRARPDKWEYMEDIGFVYYWYDHDYRAGGGVVREGRRGARRARLAEAARGDDAGAGRRSSIVADDVGGDLAVGARSTGCARRAEHPCSSCTRSIRSTSFRPRLDAFAQRAGARPRRLGDRRSRRAYFRGIPLDPSGTPYELTPDGRVQLSPSSPLFPLPAEPQQRTARRDDRPLSRRLRGALRRRHRQLSQRLHPSPAARHVDCVAGLGVSALRPRPVVVREHSDRQLRGAARPLPHLPRADLDAISDRSRR